MTDASTGQTAQCFQVMVASGDEDLYLPGMEGTPLEASSLEGAIAALAEYGYTDDDCYFVYSYDQRRFKMVQESRGFANWLDTAATFSGSIAAFLRSWQQIQRTARKLSWQLGPEGQEGTLTVELVEIPYKAFYDACSDSRYTNHPFQHQDLLCCGAMATWTAPGGKSVCFRPFDYVTNNGSRRRKSFDEEIDPALSASWRSLRKPTWLSHPLDELLSGIADLTCRLPNITREGMLPKEIGDKLPEITAKAVDGECQLITVNTAELMEDESYWSDCHDIICWHDDPEALCRIAGHLGLTDWLVFNRKGYLVGMSDDASKRRDAELSENGLAKIWVERDRLMKSLLPIEMTAGKMGKHELNITITPTGATLHSDEAVSLARIVATWNSQTICDYVTHSSNLSDIDIVSGMKFPLNEWELKTMIQKKLNLFFAAASGTPAFLEGHLGSDEQLKKRCADLQTAFCELLRWNGIDHGSSPGAKGHYKGCAGKESLYHASMELVTHRFAPKVRENIRDRIFGSCGCDFLRWLRAVTSAA